MHLCLSLFSSKICTHVMKFETLGFLPKNPGIAKKNGLLLLHLLGLDDFFCEEIFFLTALHLPLLFIFWSSRKQMTRSSRTIRVQWNSWKTFIWYFNSFSLWILVYFLKCSWGTQLLSNFDGQWVYEAEKLSGTVMGRFLEHSPCICSALWIFSFIILKLCGCFVLKKTLP